MALLTFLGLNSLEKISPKIWRIIEINDVSRKKILSAIVLIIIPLSTYSFMETKAQIENKNYISNKNTLIGEIKSGNYQEETAKLLYRTVKMKPNDKTIYSLIAWKKNSLRRDIENKDFRKISPKESA